MKGVSAPATGRHSNTRNPILLEPIIHIYHDSCYQLLFKQSRFARGGKTMERILYYAFIIGVSLSIGLFASCESDDTTGPDNGGGDPNFTGEIIVDHACCGIGDIPQAAIETAKANLIIAYGHTSHGSQLVTGMTGLVTYMGALYEFNGDGSEGALQLRDMPFSGAYDLGNPDRTAWAAATRTYLEAHTEVNVIIWSWCGQVSDATEENINTYLSLMNSLESDYPDVAFVYMTGHLDGSGLTGNLHLRNEQIREYCRSHDKILYDFADIETYDPDGTYFGDKIPNDACDYDTDGNLTRDGNWAIEWQNANPGEWYDCLSAHSQPLNANLKAYAAWHLWARLAGWTG